MFNLKCNYYKYLYIYILLYLEPIDDPTVWLEKAFFWRVQPPKQKDKQVPGIQYVYSICIYIYIYY